MKDNISLASEMICDEQKKARRWRTAFFAALSLLTVAIGAIRLSGSKK